MTDWRSTPSTGIRRLHFRSLSLPRKYHPFLDIHLHYKLFMFSSFALSASLFARDIKCFRIGSGVDPEGGNIF